MHLIVRLAVGLAVGLAVVFAIDRLLWPGTFASAAVGVVVAVAVLAVAQIGDPRG